jgi:hypothetical protein
MSEVSRILACVSSAFKSGLLDQSQHDRLLTLASNKNERALTLIQHVDDVEQFAEAAIGVLNELSDDSDEKKSAPRERKPRALNISVVKEANVSRQAIEQDEEQTESDLALREKRLNGSKRRTMPEKLQIDPSKLASEAKQAKD